MVALVEYRLASETPAHVAAAQWMAQMHPKLLNNRFALVSQSASGLTYSRKYMKRSAFWAGLLLFPLGMAVWAAGRRERELVVSFESAEGGGSVWVARGWLGRRARADLERAGFVEQAAREAFV